MSLANIILNFTQCHPESLPRNRLIETVFKVKLRLKQVSQGNLRVWVKSGIQWSEKWGLLPDGR